MNMFTYSHRFAWLNIRYVRLVHEGLHMLEPPKDMMLGLSAAQTRNKIEFEPEDWTMGI